ncbi:volume-regulated anion channel subunit LRRC8B [Latimeria chalumnae]|uniref:volume-regulated anion channel subunit LRRC8B n=1 Tax=Latimeria chalumnae TaxID=7897 RepID=UPI00313D4BA8
MFTVTELKHFSDTQAAYHILKPWWDVLCHYISMVMLLIAVLGGALQFSQSKLLCLPCKLTRDKNCTVAWDFGDTISSVQSETIVNVTLPNGITNYLDRQQYSYVDAVCYEKQLHWFAKFFPYLVLLQTFIFVICGNFWLKFPSTSSRLEHFVAILHKCFDSPWTTRSLSETVAEQRSEKLSFSKSSNLLGFSTTDVESSKSLISHAQIGPEIKAVDTTISKVLDKREGEQAKAIFEKVKKFRMHVEEKDIIYKLYMKQIIAKIEALPDSLFQCKNLQYLLLGRNSLSTLSPQICELVNLIKLELTGNQLELLPVELERCRRLKSSGLIVEESLFNSLPSSVKDHLQKSDKLPL